MAHNLYNKEATDGKFQEKLIAGEGINIAADGKTISTTAAVPVPGNGLQLDGDNHLAVKPKTNGGITVEAEGVSVSSSITDKVDVLDGDTETLNIYGAAGTVVATIVVPTANS